MDTTRMWRKSASGDVSVVVVVLVNITVEDKNLK